MSPGPFLSPPRGLAFRNPSVLVATFGGAGLLPKAPGTWGALAATVVAVPIHVYLGPWGLVAGALIAFALGLWAVPIYVRHAERHDPGSVVIDEVVGQWLTLAALPFTPFHFAAGFMLFRLFDILKPWPISVLERRIPGAWGVILDDVGAAAFAVAAWHAVLLATGAR